MRKEKFRTEIIRVLSEHESLGHGQLAPSPNWNHKYHASSGALNELFALLLPSPNRRQRQQGKVAPHLDRVINRSTMLKFQSEMLEHLKSLFPPLLPVPEWLASELNTYPKVEPAKSIRLVSNPAQTRKSKYLAIDELHLQEGQSLCHVGPHELEILRVLDV